MNKKNGLEELTERMQDFDNSIAELKGALDEKELKRREIITSMSEFRAKDICVDVEKVIVAYLRVEAMLEPLREKVTQVKTDDPNWHKIPEVSLGKHPIFSTICDSFLRPGRMETLSEFIGSIAKVNESFGPDNIPYPKLRR